MPDPRLVSLADQAAQKYGVPPDLFRRLITQESGWNPNAVSPAGARGLTQVVPKWHPRANLSTPQGQLDYGAKHLGTLLKNFKDPALALAAYNAGAGAVKKYGGIPPFPETQAYVKAILGGGQQPGGGMPNAEEFQRSAGHLDAKRLLMLLRNQRGRSLRGMMPAPGFMGELAKLAEQARGSAVSDYSRQNLGQALEPVGEGLQQAGGDYGWAKGLAQKFGLSLASTFRDPQENKRVGGSPTSAHMRRGAAADFSGPPEAMRRFAEWAIKSGKAREVFYDPLGLMLDNGKLRKGSIGGHGDHVHVEWLR